MYRYPWMFLFLVPLAAYSLFLLFRLKTVKFPHLSGTHRGRLTWRVRLWWIPEILVLGILSTLIFLVAGPEKPASELDLQSRGLTLALVLDRSGSMSARLDTEGNPTRFEAVKGALKDFLLRRSGDGITLISFAKYPETHTPVTINTEILKGFLELIPLALEESESGTAIGDALVLAAARLKEGVPAGSGSPGVVILLTDGRQNEGKSTPEEGAEVLKTQGIRLYTIGLGGVGYIEQTGPFGTGFTGQQVDLDVEGLRAIARRTGGDFFQADDPQQLETLLKTLETGELAQLSQKTLAPRSLDLEAGLWLLAVLLLLEPFCRYFILKRGVG